MAGKKHRILIVDDEEDVHAITRLSLRGLRYRGRRLEFLTATTGRSAVEIMRRHPGIAVILLDVVMENDHAGLDACRAIRDELDNAFVRILLRTGQAGVAPEKKVIEEYDIDGYLAKGELTSMRLYTAVRTSLKAYGELMDLEAVVAERTREIQRQKAENERLLLSILPAAIAERVRSGDLGSRFETPKDAFGESTDGGTGQFDPRALAVYLPMDRRQAMARGEKLAQSTRGSALFADVTGFTPLTEVLTRELGTRRGAEELASQLDRVYGALIGEVHRQRGSIIGFSGDAVTCWFAGDDGRRAVACALNMQRIMGWFAAIETPSGSLLPLAIKAAVTHGPVRRLLVGDPEIQVIDLLAGATLDRLALAGDLAHQGEIVVGPGVIEALGDQLRLSARSLDGTEERFGVLAGLTQMIAERPWPALPSDPKLTRDANLRHWLLPAIHRRLRSGQGQFLAELRSAVALFLRFDGLDYDRDPRAGSKLDRYVRWVQQVLNRYGGALIQLTTGDKGSYLYATFGAPVAYEDATERGLTAALTLRLTPSEMPFITEVRIGISRGRMRAGECGSTIRRTYGVLGDETNVAARLMDKAPPGQIYAAGGMVSAAATRFRFRDLGKLSIRGKRRPLPVFELLGRRPGWQAAPTSGNLSGRGSEQVLLKSKLAGLRAGSGGVVLIEGEAGIGKSRLVHDLIAQAGDAATDPIHLVGAGETLEQATAYHGWRPIFHRLLAGGGQVELETALEQSSDACREMLIDILRRAATERPLLIVLDDAQWLDAESWALAAQARRDVQAMLLVISLRPIAGQAPSAYRQLLEDPEAKHMTLEPLARQQTLDLVCQHLGVESLPEAVATLIREKAGGHPRFSEELVDALRESGRIKVDGGACQVIGDLASQELPETVETLVTSIIDALEPTQQLVLKVASVVGRTFAADTLRAVYPVVEEEDRLTRSLATLERLRLIVRAPPSSSSSDTGEPDLLYALPASRHPRSGLQPAAPRPTPAAPPSDRGVDRAAPCQRP